MSVDLSYNDQWRSKEYAWRRSVNDNYNQNWIASHNLKYSETTELSDVSGIDYSTDNCGRFQVVWLKNLDKLLDMLPSSIDPASYNLVDAGCGTGISTLYLYDTFPFKSFIGFDFSKELIEKANENLKSYQKEKQAAADIQLLEADARNFKLTSNERSFIFIANSFQFVIAKDFISNNLETLKNNKCIIAYSNDEWIQDLWDMNVLKDIKRDTVNNLSLAFF